MSFEERAVHSWLHEAGRPGLLLLDNLALVEWPLLVDEAPVVVLSSNDVGRDNIDLRLLGFADEESDELLKLYFQEVAVKVQDEGEWDDVEDKYLFPFANAH